MNASNNAPTPAAIFNPSIAPRDGIDDISGFLVVNHPNIFSRVHGFCFEAR